MSEKEIKFSDNELKSLNDLRDKYTSAQLRLGQLEVQRLTLNQQIQNLDNEKIKIETEYVEIQKEESEIVNSLNEKYGPGNLDPNSGVFTPSS
jgi:predicted nuclease with TOPRIM domain|tara:strand:+ start:84 stop:362 length:279 start_codon:yes stop_codon:yes gene_type:complete